MKTMTKLPPGSVIPGDIVLLTVPTGCCNTTFSFNTWEVLEVMKTEPGEIGEESEWLFKVRSVEFPNSEWRIARLCELDRVITPKQEPAHVR